MNKTGWTIVVIIIVLIIVGLVFWNVPVGRRALQNEYRNANQLGNYDYSSSTNPNIINPNDTGGGTNTNPPPSTPPGTTIAGPIAYIGCSNTWQIVGGYHSDGGTKLWPADSDYGGGTATVWGSNVTNSNQYWRYFDSLNAQVPGAKTLWIMICIKGNDSLSGSYNGAVAAISEAKRRIPTIQDVYATALSEYPDHVCSETKTTGVQYAEQVVSDLVSNGLAKAGPVLSPLTRPDTTDGCHPNTQYRLILGNELLNFFH